MKVGETFELRWRDSAEKGEGTVVSEDAAPAVIPSQKAEPAGQGSVQATGCGEIGGWQSTTVVHPHGRVEEVVPKVSNEPVDGWWHQLKLDSKVMVVMLATWVKELKGKDTLRIKKLPGQMVISRPRVRGPARADRSNFWEWLE